LTVERRTPREGPQDSSSATDRRRGPERLEAFSDGVFAIAITLLVLEIRVPSTDQLNDPVELIKALGALWPSYVGYLLSFVTIGIIWANHHNLFRLVGRVSHGLVLANLLLLLTVGFVPFPTALLAATLETPSAQIGVLVYAATFVAVAIAFNVLWYEIRTRPGVLRDEVEAWSIAAISRSYRLGPPGYMLAFVGALISPLLGMGIIVVLTLLYLLPSSSGA
jgi:uncharacterized membrane protein